VTLRIASLAPAGSSWMKVLNAWKSTLEKETEGRLKLRFYPGGSQGDERDFVRKMRVGQLDGGVVTMTGMSMLVRPMVILVLPDFLDTYEKLDRVRLKMARDFEKLFVDEGFMMVAWGDAGKTRLFSKKPIERPSDIKAMRPWEWKDDLVFIEFYNVIGANGVRLGVPEVYPGLQTNMVDVVTSSALTAVALQWYTRVKYMTGHNSAIIAGGMVMRTRMSIPGASSGSACSTEPPPTCGGASRPSISRLWATLRRPRFSRIASSGRWRFSWRCCAAGGASWPRIVFWLTAGRR